jgi:hypothetical protein
MDSCCGGSKGPPLFFVFNGWQAEGEGRGKGGEGRGARGEGRGKRGESVCDLWSAKFLDLIQKRSLPEKKQRSPYRKEEPHTKEPKGSEGTLAKEGGMAHNGFCRSKLEEGGLAG